MKKFLGKNALVTGAESGIGQAIARELAVNGANVIITYLNDAAAAQKTLVMVNEAGSNGLIIQADVSNEQQVDNLFFNAFERYPDLDILINSAGIRSFDKHLCDLTTADFEKTMHVNLYSVFYCCRAFVKHRLQQGGKGRIINISSVHEEIVSPGKTDYCASKAAVRGFARSLAMELAGKGITVNNIAPGMILTPMNQKAIDDLSYREKMEQRIPSKVSGMPLDVAKLAVFLASDDAAYITGTTQVIDGGLMLNRVQGTVS